jgi:hypothetical protein
MDIKSAMKAVLDHARHLKGEIPMYMEEVDGPPVLKYYDGPVNENDPIFVLARQIEENPAAFAADLERFDAAMRARLFQRPKY